MSAKYPRNLIMTDRDKPLDPLAQQVEAAVAVLNPSLAAAAAQYGAQAVMGALMTVYVNLAVGLGQERAGKANVVAMTKVLGSPELARQPRAVPPRAGLCRPIRRTHHRHLGGNEAMLNNSLRAMLQADLDAEASRAARQQAFTAGLAAGLRALADETAALWAVWGSGVPLDPDRLADDALAALHHAVDDTTDDPAEFRRRLLLAAATTVVAAAALQAELQGALQ